MFTGVWAELLWAVVGAGLLGLGVIGLALGGRLPLVPIPERLRPMTKLGMTVALLIGLTLVLDFGEPDLLERVWTELTA